MQDYSVCLAKKSQVSPPPAAEQMVQPVPRQGGHSSSPTHPNKGWKEPLEVRESSHGHSGEEKRQLEPPQLQFSIGISPGTKVEGYLHPHCVHSVFREGMPQVVPARCMSDSQTRRWFLPEPGPGMWMLCSSLQLFLRGSERCEALWESSDSKNSFC